MQSPLLNWCSGSGFSFQDLIRRNHALKPLECANAQGFVDRELIVGSQARLATKFVLLPGQPSIWGLIPARFEVWIKQQSVGSGSSGLDDTIKTRTLVFDGLSILIRYFNLVDEHDFKRKKHCPGHSFVPPKSFGILQESVVKPNTLPWTLKVTSGLDGSRMTSRACFWTYPWWRPTPFYSEDGHRHFGLDHLDQQGDQQGLRPDISIRHLVTWPFLTGSFWICFIDFLCLKIGTPLNRTVRVCSDSI